MCSDTGLPAPRQLLFIQFRSYRGFEVGWRRPYFFGKLSQKSTLVVLSESCSVHDDERENVGLYTGDS